MFARSLIKVSLGLAVALLSANFAAAQVVPVDGTGCMPGVVPELNKHVRSGLEFSAHCAPAPLDMAGALGFVIVGFAAPTPVKIPEVFVCGGGACTLDTTLIAIIPDGFTVMVPSQYANVGLWIRVQSAYFMPGKICGLLSTAVDVRVKRGS